MTPATSKRSAAPAPRAYALLSVGAALVTIMLKAGAYLLTGSVGLLSDALESLVNLAAALIAVWALTLASRPPDLEHAYGHSKAEYVASAVEGALILVAAVAIGLAAWERLLNLQPLAYIWFGLAIALAAAGVNGAVAVILLRAGRRLRSIALVADAHHLLTDVWTTGGVIVGVGLVQLTGWLAFDPLIAVVVAANIVWTGLRLLHDTANGVLDTALPPIEQGKIAEVLAPYQKEGIVFHALRTRVAGQRRFVSLHVLVPGAWSVQRGHTLSEQIERQISTALPQTTVFTHIEPIEDPVSWGDQALDRTASVESELQPIDAVRD